MDEDEKELIRARTDIVELISGYTALKRAGAKYKGLCPFHQEKTPSFTVDPDRGRWHCFGACGEGGDVFTFLEKVENLTFREAAERLAERAGITLRGRGDSEEAKRLKSERDRLYAANAAALNFFREAFERATLAQEYAARRGLVHETRENFGIGYAPDDWDALARYLLRQKIHPEDAVKAGLITPSRRGDGTFIDRFRGRLMFPIVDVQERVVGFGGRLLGEKTASADGYVAPKYLNSPETPVFSKSKILYALNRGKRAISERKLAVVVEGYMDAVAAHQAGIPFVVATLGTAMTDEHARLLRRYVGEGGGVALSFDADKAGINAALKAAGVIEASGTEMTLRVLALPSGEDPDSLISKGKSAEFRRAIDNAFTVPEFRLRSMENVHDLTTDTGRMSYLREAVEILATVPSVMEQHRLIGIVAVHHPNYAVNSLRVEELIRSEVEQVSSKRKARIPTRKDDEYSDAPPPDAPPYPDDFPPPPPPPPDYGGGYGNGRAPRGNGYPRGGGNDRYGNGGGNRGSGYGRGGYGNRSRWTGQTNRPVDTSPPPRAAWNATEVAEKMIVRALLSDSWVLDLKRRFPTVETLPPFASPHVAQLFAALWPSVLAGRSPADLLDRMADPELADFADRVLMNDGSEPEITEAAMQDAVYQLRERSLRAKNAEIRAAVAQNGEGMAEPDAETLRRWSQIARTLRGKGSRPGGTAEGSPPPDDPTTE